MSSAPGNDRQQLLDRGHDLRKHRPLVQCDPLLDPPLHHRRETVGMGGEKGQERVQVERLGAELQLVIRQRHLADRDLAGRAPRQHRRGAGRGEPVDRRVGHLAVADEIAGAVLVYAAALADPAHDLVIDLEQVENVEAQQRDVRRLQHVAAGIKDHVGRAGARFVRRLEARQRLGRHLQPRQHPHAAAHRPEALPPARRRAACRRHCGGQSRAPAAP